MDLLRESWGIMIKVDSELKELVWGTENWFRLPAPFDGLLFKVIDAKEKLSVQVHPGDEYARMHEGGSLGKTEVWYILDAEPGATLVYGLKEGVGKEEFERAILEGKVEDTLNYVSVSKGDIFFIPAGMVHAIGAGIKLAELQQNSDITYRVYDYGRQPARELHIEKALDVISVDREVKCKYFELEEVLVSDKMTFDKEKIVFVDDELFLVGKGEELLYNGEILVMGL